MAQYGYNAPGHSGYKREEPYTTYGNTSSYAGSHYPDHQYVIKPVLTTSTYVVEEKTQVRETQRPTNKGYYYYQPASNMDFDPPKNKEYVTKAGSHPLPSYTHQSHGYDEPNSYGGSARKNPGDYNYSDYNSYGGDNNRNSNGGWSRGVAGHAAPLTRTTNDIRDFFEGNDIRDVIETEREAEYEHSPTSLGKADTHHQSRQEYGRGQGGFNLLTRPYATGEPPRTIIKKH